MSDRDEARTFLQAVEDGKAETVEAILARRPGLAGAQAHEGVSPVLAALYRGHGGVLSALLARTDPDLFEAAALGRTERLRELLDEDTAPIDARSADGWTPLHLAAFFGHEAAVRLLLERGAPLEAVSGNRMENRPLHAALAGRGEEGVVEALLAAGADAEAEAAGGYTPLHLAASRGSTATIRRLLERGADPDRRDAEGRRPAEIARERGHPEAAADLERTAGGGPP